MSWVMDHCAICQRPELCTRHHLIPRTLHGRLKRTGKADTNTLHHTVLCCPPCHQTIHHLFTEKELATRLNSVSDLLGDLRLRKWRDWIRTKPTGYRPRCRQPR